MMNIQGKVEELKGGFVTGWVYEPLTHPLQVRVRQGEKIVVSGETNIKRKDVSELVRSEKDHGFQLKVGAQMTPTGFDTAVVEVMVGGNWYPLDKSETKKEGRYQSFDSFEGSASHEKLAALNLKHLSNRSPDKELPLKGMSVLDIGCNEGFFCIQALKMGATRVVGIDKFQKWIDLAKQRSSEVEYRVGSWWDIPDGEKFDLIFLLSAIHYEPEQKRLLDKLATHLTPTGVLVLECGAIPKAGETYWQPAVRGAGDKKYYPTIDLLVDGLLSSYSARFCGPSVKQGGDPIPRYVYHCALRRSVAILMGAAPQSGKTSLTRDFAMNGVPSYSVDNFLFRARKDPQILGKKAFEALLTMHPNPPEGLVLFGDIMLNHFFEECCDALVAELPVEFPKFIVQGQFMSYPKVRDYVAQALAKRNVRVWTMDYQDPSASASA